MKSLVAVVVLCAALGVAHARPLVIQESARLSNPDPSYPSFGRGIAVDGDDALIMLSRYTPPEDEFGTGEAEDLAVWLFRRVNGTWTPIRQLETQHHGAFAIDGGDVAAQNGVAGFALNPLSIWERRNDEWVKVLADQLRGEAGTSVEVDSGRVIYGGSSGTFTGTVFERDATGAWHQAARLEGSFRTGDDERSGSEVDISGGRAVVVSDYSEEPPVFTPNVTVYSFNPSLGWVFDGVIDYHPNLWPIGTEAAVRGDEVFVSGTFATGTHVFRPAPPEVFQFDWTQQDRLQPLDSYMSGSGTARIKKTAEFVLQTNWSTDRAAGVINVFQRDANGAYQHVATLTASNGDSVGRFAISGRRVLAACDGQVCAFELPASLAQPARIQDTFPGSTHTGWNVNTGSLFSVVQSGVSRVLRQAETASPATHTAVLSHSNWTNQAIQADIKPTAFNGNDRWFGVATRWRDASNYYYVTVRQSGSVSLRRNVNGVFSVIASAPLGVRLNQTYKVRLESIGTRHRVYVDGAPMLDADDSSIASGRAALMTFRSAAEFDNVVASPTPTTTMYAFDLQSGPNSISIERGAFTETGPGLWLVGRQADSSLFMSQTSVAGDARAVTGVATDDQAIEVRARATTFAGTGGGVRWFGVTARYQEDSKYYYLSVRSDNTVSLRKVLGTNITILGTISMPVTLGQWYRLRLEAIGNNLRAYVNGRPVIEATDDTFASGRTGFVTFRTAADFDDYRAFQP